MFATHTMPNGKKKSICEINTNELTAITEELLISIKDSIYQIDNYSINKSKAALRGVSEEDIKQGLVNTLHNRGTMLCSYVTELCLRGVNMTERLQDAFGRKEVEDSIPIISNTGVTMLENF